MKWLAKAALQNIKYAGRLLADAVMPRNGRNLPLVRFSVGGKDPSFAHPLCIVSSFDGESRVRRYLFMLIEAMSSAGFDIVFVSASAGLSDVDVEKLGSTCVRVISRENFGYDFYSWKTGMAEYPDYARHAGLLLLNDSVMGPLFDIGDLVGRLEAFPADIVGMTDSTRFCRHLQSYFVYFKRHVVNSVEFRAFFDAVEAEDYKEAIIRRYEVGLSRLLKKKYTIGALYELEQVREKSGYTARPLAWTNPTVHLWRELIEDWRFPFLKKSVITSGNWSINDVRSILASCGSCYDPRLLDLD